MTEPTPPATPPAEPATPPADPPTVAVNPEPGQKTTTTTEPAKTPPGSGESDLRGKQTEQF